METFDIKIFHLSCIYLHPGSAISKYGALGGIDGQSMDANRDSTEWKYEFWDRTEYDLNLGIGAASVTHGILLGEDSFLKSTMAATVNSTKWNQYRLNNRMDLQPNLQINNTAGRLLFNAKINQRLNSSHINETGIGLQHLFYDLGVRVAPEDRPPLIPFSSGTGNSQLIQIFTQSRIQPIADPNIHMGVHSMWSTLNNNIVVEPRVGLEWQLSGKSGINLGYGLHSQIEDLRIYFLQPDQQLPNRSLDLTRAHHVVA